jgi:DNA-binding IscR family transcriptional regulator
MSTMSGRSSLGEFHDRPLSYPPEPQRLLKTLLEALAFLDSAHEGDVETVRNSTVDEGIKRTVIRRLEHSLEVSMLVPTTRGARQPDRLQV